MRAPRGVRRFLTLPMQTRVAFLSALAVVLVVRIGLWALPVRRVRSIGRRLVRHPVGGGVPDQVVADRIAWAVRRAAAFVPRASCLTQALAAELLLARAGHAAEVRLGVAKDEHGKIEAHAWVESSGRVIVGDGDLEHYATLIRSPSQIQ